MPVALSGPYVVRHPYPRPSLASVFVVVVGLSLHAVVALRHHGTSWWHILLSLTPFCCLLSGARHRVGVRTWKWWEGSDISLGGQT